MTRIAVFVGSLQEKSLNMRLAKNLEQLAPKSVQFEYVDIGSVPLYSEDLEADFPASARKIKEQVEQADGVLFVTPEYNRGMPGVLKNAIDWTSRPWLHNSFDGKPAGIVGASPTPNGTTQAQQQLRNVLVYLNMKLLGQPEVYFAFAANKFDDNGAILEEFKPQLQEYIDTFSEWVEK